MESIIQHLGVLPPDQRNSAAFIGFLVDSMEWIWILMGYRRVCGGFRRMPKPPQISAVTHQISHSNHETFKFTRDFETSNLAGNTGTPDFDVLPADFEAIKSQRDYTASR